MKIDIELTRKDLLALNIHLYPRMKANWISLGLIIISIAIFLAISKKPNDFSGYFSLAVSSVLGGLGGVIIVLIINLISMQLTIGKKSGVLGTHQFELLKEGIRESTSVNESLQRWESIIEIKIYGSFLLVRINNYLVHVIPKRAFKNQEAFEDFYNEALRLKMAFENGVAS
ncbi:MAG: YcxB family protein [Candidatus Aquirickettsiella gammari]